LGRAQIRRSLVCAGVRAGDISVDHSVLGTRTVVKSGVTIEHSYIAGADYYESADALGENRERGLTDVGIGGDTVIRRAIVDKNARIGYGVRIDPGAECPDMDGDGYAVREGIAIIEKDAVIPDGSVIPERR
jgi:glucose-1-phosphate adenylyltransferase